MSTSQATLSLPRLAWLRRAREIQSQWAVRLEPALLLGIRLLFGYGIAVAGYGKLTHLDRVVGFFSQLGMPWPSLSAPFVGGVELVGGLLLCAGLLSRLASIPLLITMVVALLSAHGSELAVIFDDPGTFIGASPVPFLGAFAAVLILGPGRWSLDHLLAERLVGSERASRASRGSAA